MMQSAAYTPCTIRHTSEQERIECVRARHRARAAAVDEGCRAWLAQLAIEDARLASLHEPAPAATLPREWREAFVETLASDAEFRTAARGWLEVSV
jgi:hypothetical protein